MRKKSELENIKKRILPILKEHGVTKAGLFGSCVRGEMKKGSDVDILVKMPDNISLLGFVGVKLELEEALGRKVDLVEYDTIKPLLKDSILNEQVEIL
jgi:predicted nucleotidyltransferase